VKELTNKVRSILRFESIKYIKQIQIYITVKYDPEKYQRNRESQLAACKRYYQRNREVRLSKQKEYDDNHREEITRRHKENHYGGKRKTKIELTS